MNRSAATNDAFVSAIGGDATNRRVERLGRHRVARGQLDIRGWIALTEDGQRVGRVAELLVDMQSLLVACVEIALDVQLAGGRGARRVVVPIGCARVSSHRKHVNIRGVTAAELVHAPRFGARRIGPIEHGLLRRFFLRPATAAALDVQSVDERDRIAQEQALFWGARHNGRRLDAYLSDAAEPD